MIAEALAATMSSPAVEDRDLQDAAAEAGRGDRPRRATLTNRSSNRQRQEGGHIMYARVTSTQADPARLDEGIAYIRDEVLPKTNLMKGSLGSVVGVDRSSGRGCLMSCWTDRESLDASHQAVVGMRSAAARRLDGSDTIVETFEIALIHLAKPAEPGSCTSTTRTEMPPDDLHRALQSFKDTVVPFLEKYDRICAVIVMVNRQAGVLQTSITLENREAFEASRSRTQEARDLITAAIPSGKIVEVFELEVVISDLRPSS